MKDKRTRRKILSTVAVGGASTVFLSARGLASASEPSDERGKSSRRLFRVLNNSTEDGETTVRIRRKDSGKHVQEFSLKTAGGNHPDLRSKPSKAKIPEIAAEMSSFGGLARGKWVMEILHGSNSEEVEFEMGPFGLVDGNVVQARILPGGELRVSQNHEDSGIEA
ncbi:MULTISPECIES: hypothetical protein [Halomarina]|uniref:Uncharacterized protein n=2 Tax=Halomarina TaxID=871740 RepID=A0A6B0GFY1_9EURY|nr:MULTISPECIES: hypothetical protein [Halomarina]MWG33732.1 hypothetical protein [Halomarina oriensis]